MRSSGRDSTARAQAGAGAWKLPPTGSTLLRESGGVELNLLEIQGSSGKDADEGRELQDVSFTGANAFDAIILDPLLASVPSPQQ